MMGWYIQRDPKPGELPLFWDGASWNRNGAHVYDEEVIAESVASGMEVDALVRKCDGIIEPLVRPGRVFERLTFGATVDKTVPTIINSRRVCHEIARRAGLEVVDQQVPGKIHWHRQKFWLGLSARDLSELKAGQSAFRHVDAEGAYQLVTSTAAALSKIASPLKLKSYRYIWVGENGEVWLGFNNVRPKTRPA